MPDRDHEHAHHKTAGVAMAGTIIFCTLTGAGVGVFTEQPLIGALIGGAFGILLGFWLVPRLLRDAG